MKPLSATVVLSYFIYSELSPFYGIIREDDKIFALWYLKVFTFNLSLNRSHGRDNMHIYSVFCVDNF